MFEGEELFEQMEGDAAAAEADAQIGIEAEQHEAREKHLGRMVWLAMWKDYKGYDNCKFRDCDYGSDLTRDQQDEVFDLCDELNAIGSVAFRERYGRFKLFP